MKLVFLTLLFGAQLSWAGYGSCRLDQNANRKDADTSLVCEVQNFDGQLVSTTSYEQPIVDRQSEEFDEAACSADWTEMTVVGPVTVSYYNNEIWVHGQIQSGTPAQTQKVVSFLNTKIGLNQNVETSISREGQKDMFVKVRCNLQMLHSS